MKLFNWTNTRLVLMIESFFLFRLLRRNGHRKLKKSEVFFVKKTLFIKQETVNKLLIEYNENASSIEKIN
jgi:cell division protein FtsQ